MVSVPHAGLGHVLADTPRKREKQWKPLSFWKPAGCKDPGRVQPPAPPHWKWLGSIGGQGGDKAVPPLERQPSELSISTSCTFDLKASEAGCGSSPLTFLPAPSGICETGLHISCPFLSFPGDRPRPEHTAGCSNTLTETSKKLQVSKHWTLPSPIPTVCLMTAPLLITAVTHASGTPLGPGHSHFTAGHRLGGPMSCQMWEGQDSNPRAPLRSPVKESPGSLVKYVG